MMNKRIKRGLIIFLSAALMITGSPVKTDAKTKIHLSKTKRTYDWAGLWDKVTLKGVPSNAKIMWKSSDSKVVKIKERIKRGTWYHLVGAGKANVTARYKGKTYICRITVKGETSEQTPKPTKTPKPDLDDEQDDSVFDEAHMNATEVTLYRCPGWAMPYAHDPDHPLQFQFKVLGTNEKPYWKLDFDTKPGLNLSQDGLLTFADIYLSEKNEATVTAKLSNTKKLIAHVTIVSEVEICYNKKVEEFKARYIHDGMSDVEIAKAICKYISEEYDYSKEAGWVAMVVTGAGDCMASRVGVATLCKEFGIKAYACCDLSDHGECIIRIGDDVYMSITGYGGAKPRPFSFYKMSEEAIQKKFSEYRDCKDKLGF